MEPTAKKAAAAAAGIRCGVAGGLGRGRGVLGQPVVAGARDRVGGLCTAGGCALALWLLLDCPLRREQRPEELAVFNMDKATPGSVVLLAVTLFFWLYLPEGMIRTESGSLQLEGWLAESLLGFACMGLAVYMLVAFRNEVLFVAPDGSVECWNVLGQHRLVEERAAMVRIRPLLGRSYVCDAAGNVLYHFDRGMINTEPLLDWLQSQG